MVLHMMSRRLAGRLTALALLAGASPGAGPGVPGGPTLLARGELSTPLNERGFSLSPSGDTVYFAIRVGDGYLSALVMSVRRNGHWTERQVLPFSGRWFDADPSLSPDGRTLYFSSLRPVNGVARKDQDIWAADLTTAGWGEPRRLPEPVNSGVNETGPTVAADGTLYFVSTRPGGRGAQDIWIAHPSGAGYEVANFGAPVNSDAAELWPAVSPDGSRLVFTGVGRPDEILGPGNAYQRGDLYQSRRTASGWSAPVHLPAPINSSAAECCALFSRDGSRLFYTSERGLVTDGAPRRLTRADVDRILGDVLNGGGNPYELPVSALDGAAAPGPAPPPLDFTPAAERPASPIGGVDQGWPAPADSAAHLLAEGVVSTAANEFGGAISPDGQELYFARSVPRSYFYAILVSRLERGRWTTPEVAPFSGRYRDFDVNFAPDGSRLFFVSDRPVDGKRPAHYSFWVMDRAGRGWSEPRAIEDPLNSPAGDWFISAAADGTVYFASARDDTTGYSAIYRSRRVNGRYERPERLAAEVNLPGAFLTEPAIAPDQSYLLFSATFGNIDGYDIYISYQRNGAWTRAERLNDLVNTDTRDYSPRLAPDGKTLIFTSERHFATGGIARPLTYAELVRGAGSTLNGHGNIYSIPLRAALRNP